MCVVRSCSCPSHRVHKSDGRGVDAGAEQHHRGGVSQRVHRHLFWSQRRALQLPRGLEVFGKASFDRVARELTAGAGREERVGWLACPLAHPDLEHGDGLSRQRRDSLLLPFPNARR